MFNKLRHSQKIIFVSINVKTSIYRPGLIASFLLIVFIAASLTSCNPPNQKSSLNSIQTETGGNISEFDPKILNPGPTHGDTLVTNPPGFHWTADKGTKGFILEISRDINFGGCTKLLKKLPKDKGLIPASLAEVPHIYKEKTSWVVAGLPLPLYRPSFVMGNGDWYWRWRSVLIEGTISAPSNIRKFTISPESREYIVPPLKKLFAQIPGSHPRLFIRPEQLDSLRGLLQTSKPHRDLFYRIAEYADSLLLLPVNQEPGSILQKDGKFSYHLWRDYYEQARKSGQVLDFLSFCYLITGEKKYAERTRQWLLAFAGWNPEGNSSMFNNDEVAMPILLNGARAYDWVYDFLNDNDRAIIRDMLVVRGEQAYKRFQIADYHYKPFTSHLTRLVNYMSQVGVVLYGETREAEKWLSYIMPIVTTFYPPWGGKDGGYSEGPSYWMMYFNYMLQSAYCIESAMKLDILKKEFYQNSGWFKIYAYPYYGVMRPFADMGIGSYWPADKINLYRLATVFQNPYYRWRAEMSPPKQMPVAETKIPTGIMSFFWLDEASDAIKPKAPDDLPKARLFRDIGLVAFHEDPGNPMEAYFLLKSSPFGSWSHIYADQNTFYIQGFGEALAIQSGYYPHYGHPHHTEWTWKTHAHNSVLVDGEGQRIRDRTSRGKIIAFKTGNGLPGSVDYAAGDATEAYQGRLDKFIRHVYYQRPKDFLLIDELEAPKQVRFDWLLHALEKMQIDSVNNKVTIRKGKAQLIVEFLSPEELLFSQTNKFTVSPGRSYPEGIIYPDQWHLTVSTKHKARAATFIVHMKVNSSL